MEEDTALEKALHSIGFRNGLNRFLLDQEGGTEVLPWASRLTPQEHLWFCNDLESLLAEPEETGEPLDMREIGEILREYAEIAGWEGPLWCEAAVSEREAPLFTLDVRPQELRAIRRAALGVRKAVAELLNGFLVTTPTDASQLGGYKIKKLSDRDIRQIDLPDDYRLRYFVDEKERIVYIVYLGPHPTGTEDGRERSVRAIVNRRRYGRE